MAPITFRESAMQSVMSYIRDAGVNVTIYEPELNSESFHEFPVTNDFSQFILGSDVVLANRIDPILNPYLDKVYTRDVFGCD